MTLTLQQFFDFADSDPRGPFPKLTVTVEQARELRSEIETEMAKPPAQFEPKTKNSPLDAELQLRNQQKMRAEDEGMDWDSIDIAVRARQVAHGRISQ